MGEKDFCLSVFVLVLHFHKDIVFSLPFAAVFDGQKNRGGRWCSTWRWKEFLLWLPAIDRLANGNTGILAPALIGFIVKPLSAVSQQAQLLIAQACRVRLLVDIFVGN